jgi:hypothetical protein
MLTKITQALISEISKYGDARDIEMHLSFEEDLKMNEYKMNDLLEILEEEFSVELLQYSNDFIKVNDLVSFIRESVK